MNENEDEYAITLIRKSAYVSGACAATVTEGVGKFKDMMGTEAITYFYFNSFAKTLPACAYLIMNGLDLGIEDFIANVNEGQITTSDIHMVLFEHAPRIEQSFNELPFALDRAISDLIDKIVKLLRRGVIYNG